MNTSKSVAASTQMFISGSILYTRHLYYRGSYVVVLYLEISGLCFVQTWIHLLLLLLLLVFDFTRVGNLEWQNESVDVVGRVIPEF